MAGVKGSRMFPLTIGAGLEATINVGGEFFYVLTCNQTSFLLAMDNDGLDYAKLRTYKRVEQGVQFDSLRISNPNATDLVIQIVAGFGEYGDDEVEVGGSISIDRPATQTPGTDLVIASGATGNIAAAATRQELLMMATGKLRLSGVTGKGMEWDGKQMALTTKGQVDFFNDTAAAITVKFTELLT